MYSPALTALNAIPSPPTAGAPTGSDGGGFARLLEQAHESQRPAGSDAAAATAPATAPGNDGTGSGLRRQGDAAGEVDDSRSARPAAPVLATAMAPRGSSPRATGVAHRDGVADHAPAPQGMHAPADSPPVAGEPTACDERLADDANLRAGAGADVALQPAAPPACAPAAFPEPAQALADAAPAGVPDARPDPARRREAAQTAAAKSSATTELAVAGSPNLASLPGAPGTAIPARAAADMQAAAQATGAGTIATGDAAAASDGAATFAAALAAATNTAAHVPPAATPAAEARLAAEPGTPAFARELGTQVTTFVRDGLHHAVLELNPAEMGPVTVQIQLDGVTAQVHLSADQASTRQALAQAMPQLAGSLREAGLMLAGGGVFEQARQMSSNADGSGARDEGRGRRGDRGSARGSLSAVEGITVDRAPATAVRRGVVDLLA